jgi:hypothetical protein
MTRVTLALAVALALASLAPFVGAQAVPTQLAGSWRHDGAVSSGMRTVDGAFAASIATLPELFQGIARERIRTSLAPPPRITVTLTGERIRVSLDHDDPTTVVGALNAHAATTGVDDGTTVTPRLSGGWLDLVYEGESSEMHQLFSTEADGAHMHVDYTVENDRLAGTVRYRLEYVRAE